MIQTPHCQKSSSFQYPPTSRPRSTSYKRVCLSMDMDCEPALPAEPECYLPPNCVAEIAAKVTQQRNWVYQIMAMAGVNPLWRAIVSQLPATTALTLEPQHKVCSLHVQRDFLMGVAGLLSGYGSLVCRGQAIQDSIILKVSLS